MLDLEKEKCVGCSACYNACPKNCINMVPDKEGFLYPQITSQSCIECGLCEKVCPVIHLARLNGKEQDVDAYAAHTKDETVRKNSSSGGVFTELARYVIGQGGVVFAAAFHKNHTVAHTFTENEEGLSGFRGSKYVQSRIGETFKQAQSYLKQGRLVLFTGTPCQIVGLRRYLREPYDNLITQDIVCHGVPSPLAWDRYVKCRETEARSEIKKISFRDKSNSWRSYLLRIVFENSAEYQQSSRKDPYMQAFLSNLSLRPSCYHCRFKGEERSGDITLADFWGIENIIPEMDDGKGTSLVLVNTCKGKAVFDEIKEGLVYKPANMETAVLYNPSAVKAAALPEKRQMFFERIQCEPFDKVVKEICVKGSFGKRLLRKVKHLLNKKLGK